MKQRVSELMDGELNDHAAAEAIVVLRKQSELRESWSTYHLIGDVLRQTGGIVPEFEQRIAESLSQEATVLAPRRLIPQRWSRPAWAAAASLAAVSMVLWVAAQTPGDKPAGNQLGPIAATALVPQTQQNPDVRPYLAAHQEFTPIMRGAVPQQVAFDAQVPNH